MEISAEILRELQNSMMGNGKGNEESSEEVVSTAEDTTEDSENAEKNEILIDEYGLDYTEDIEYSIEYAKEHNYGPEFKLPRTMSEVTVNVIERAINENKILSAFVETCTPQHNLKLKLGNNTEPNLSAEIKFDKLEYNFGNTEVKDVSAVSKVGKFIKFKPTSIEKSGNNTIVECSRYAAQKECYDNYVSKLVPGDIVESRVVRVENYGVFCDIGCGIIALLPTNYISVTHIMDPISLFRNSEITKMYTVIKRIKEDGKIELTHQELIGTWESEASKFESGQVVCGTVLSIQDYGVFIRISQNLAGLATPCDLDLMPGDLVSVRVNDVISESMKAKLTILDRVINQSEQIQFKYMITKGHINRWTYSTQGSIKKGRKVIETLF